MRKILAILSVILATGFTLHAATLPAAKQKEVISQINKAASGLKSMTCSFVQTKYLSLLSDRMVSQGKMSYRHPDKLRWEYTSPYQYLFIFNRNKVFVGNNSRKDVIDTGSNKLFKEVARIMMGTVTGTALSNPSDFTTTVADSKDNWIVTLIPRKKEMKKMFAKIVLCFSKADLMISEINLFEKNNDRTQIKLKNISTNIPVNESLFAIHK